MPLYTKEGCEALPEAGGAKPKFVNTNHTGTEDCYGECLKQGLHGEPFDGSFTYDNRGVCIPPTKAPTKAPTEAPTNTQCKPYKCYGTTPMPFYSKEGCEALPATGGAKGKFVGVQKEDCYGECLKQGLHGESFGGSFTWDNRGVCTPSTKTPAPTRAPTEKPEKGQDGGACFYPPEEMGNKHEGTFRNYDKNLYKYVFSIGNTGFMKQYPLEGPHSGPEERWSTTGFYIGKYKRQELSDPDSDDVVLDYTKGQGTYCDGNKRRSGKVFLVCKEGAPEGGTIVDVQEPHQCEYEVKFGMQQCCIEGMHR